MSHGLVRNAIAAATIASLAAAGASAAQASSGGATIPSAPTVSEVRCVSTPEMACASGRAVVRGARARVAGRSLASAARIVFLGRRTRRDDVAVRPRHRSDGHVDAVVPARARSGRVAVVDDIGRRAVTSRRVRVIAPPPIDAAPGGAYRIGGRRKPTLSLPPTAPRPVTVEVLARDDTPLSTFEASGESARWNGMLGGRPAPPGVYSLRAAGATGDRFTIYDHLFPIRGRHNLGYTRTNRFGGGRGHQGIDMFADCGTPIAAARGGRVQVAGYQGAAGNHVVIDGARTSRDYVYMHMRERPLVRTGQRVFTGQLLGEVGDTGRATGCHLHFELWSGPGWYEGGSPFDALPALRRWREYD